MCTRRHLQTGTREFLPTNHRNDVSVTCDQSTSRLSCSIVSSRISMYLLIFSCSVVLRQEVCASRTANLKNEKSCRATNQDQWDVIWKERDRTRSASRYHPPSEKEDFSMNFMIQSVVTYCMRRKRIFNQITTFSAKLRYHWHRSKTYMKSTDQRSLHRVVVSVIKIIWEVSFEYSVAKVTVPETFCQSEISLQSHEGSRGEVNIVHEGLRPTWRQLQCRPKLEKEESWLSVNILWSDDTWSTLNEQVTDSSIREVSTLKVFSFSFGVSG